MIRVLLCGVAAAALMAAPAAAQQPPPRAGNAQGAGGGGALTLQQAMQQEQQRRAQREAEAEAALQRDLARMTPAARQQYLDFTEQRVQQVFGERQLDRAGEALVSDLTRNVGNLLQTLGGNEVIIESGRTMTNAEFGWEAAHGLVQTVNGLVQTQIDVQRSLRPLVLDIGAAAQDIMLERQRLLLASNPNMSDRDRDILRHETSSSINAMRNLDRRLDESEFRMREEQRVVSESEQRVAAEMERMASQQGQTMRDWDISSIRRTQPVRYDVRPRPEPDGQGTGIPDVDNWGIPTPSPSPSPGAGQAQQTGGAATRAPARRGTIPSADPYADFRVPSNLGGTGPAIDLPPRDGAQQDLQAESNAQPAMTAEQRAEHNARRTEWLRQQAMARMRDDNAEIDGQPRPGERVDDFEFGDRDSRMIPLQIRPFGGGSGSGGGGVGEQMAGGGLLDGEFGDFEWDADGGCCRVSPTEAFLFGDGDGTAGRLADLAEPDAWQSFEMGGIITVAELVPIYYGYDWWNAPIGSSGRSLSSAGTSLSAAGNSLSSAGMSLSLAGSITPSSAPTGMRVDWGGYNLAADPLRVANGGRPEPGSYADMLRQINGPGPSLINANPWSDAPWATSNRDLAQLMYGPLWSDRPYQIQADPYGRRGQGMGGPEVANLFDTDLDVLLRLLGSDFDYLRVLLASDRGGLDRLLAQPFNVLLTWGPDAFDLDLHMTGPLEPGTSDRFHIYFAADGRLDAQPFAELIRDCVCASGSEVILTSALNRGGGVYRVSVFNFGNQSATSTNLANQSDAVLQIVRGGTAVSLGNGTTIEGGVTLLTVTPPPAQPGNTWVAAEIDPNNGRITSPGFIRQSQGSGNVE